VKDEVQDLDTCDILLLLKLLCDSTSSCHCSQRMSFTFISFAALLVNLATKSYNLEAIYTRLLIKFFHHSKLMNLLAYNEDILCFIGMQRY